MLRWMEVLGLMDPDEKRIYFTPTTDQPSMCIPAEQICYRKHNMTPRSRPNGDLKGLVGTIRVLAKSSSKNIGLGHCWVSFRVSS